MRSEYPPPQSTADDVIRQFAQEHGMDIARCSAAAALIRKEVQNARRVGRTLTPSKREVVIPVEDIYQREALYDAFAALTIHPYEESGCLIVERALDLEKLLALGLCTEPGAPVAEIAPQLPDRTYKYPLPHPDIPHTTFTPHRDPSTAQVHGEEVQDVVDGLKERELRFRAGFSLEEEEEPVRSHYSYPRTPIRNDYIWRNGRCYKRTTGEEVPAEAQKELIARAKDGDEAAKETLLRIHSGLVRSVLMRVQQKFGGDSDDLLQEGHIALVNALEKYEEGRAKFSTYAALYIESAMRRYIADTRGDIRIPGHIQAERNRLHTTAGIVSRVHMDERELVESALHNITPEELDRKKRRTLHGARYGGDIAEHERKIDPPVGDDGALLIEESNAEDAIFKQELTSQMTEALRSLPPRTRFLLCARFGVTQGQPFSIKEALTLCSTSWYREPQEMLASKLCGILQAGKNVTFTDVDDLSERDKYLLVLCGLLDEGCLRICSVNDRMGEANERYTLGEVAHFYGVTPERIRALEWNALRTLRHSRKTKGLQAFRVNREKPQN